VLVHGDALGDPGVGEDDEPEPTGAACVAVPHDNGLGDLPEATEVLAEAVLVRLPRDAADEELPGVVGGLHRSPPLLSSPCSQQTHVSQERQMRTKRQLIHSPHPRTGHTRAHIGWIRAEHNAAIAELRAGRARSVPDPAGPRRDPAERGRSGRGARTESGRGRGIGTLTGGSAAAARRDPSAIGGRRVKKRRAEQRREEGGGGSVVRCGGGMIEFGEEIVLVFYMGERRPNFFIF